MAATSLLVKDKRMPMMNEIVDVLESVTEDLEEWVVPKAPELKPEVSPPPLALSLARSHVSWV
jgi:hypothetical protein